jgi:hypothetical protein
MHNNGFNSVMVTIGSCANCEEDGRIIVYGTIAALLIAVGFGIWVWRICR